MSRHSSSKSEDLFFVDANIYLDFYWRDRAKITDLLNSLLAIRGIVFVTVQVRDEVIRNRSRITQVRINECINGIELPKVTIPQHLVPEVAGDLAAWEKGYSEARGGESRPGLRERLQVIGNKIIREVVLGRDSVSTQLSTLFAGAKKHTGEALARAHERKARGNPPGKQKDPVGDELSWEMLLEEYDGTQRVWIVSHDGDFFIDLGNGKLELHPILLRDLQHKCASPVIECHRGLRDALEAYAEATQTKKLSVPSKADLPDPPVVFPNYNFCVEPSGVPFPAFVHTSTAGPPGIPDFPVVCRTCGGPTLSSGILSHSGIGSWKSTCPRCGTTDVSLSG